MRLLVVRPLRGPDLKLLDGAYSRCEGVGLSSRTPSPDKSLFEATHGESSTSVLVLSHKALGESPRTPALLGQTAETRRHRSTAADLGRQSLVCLFQPGPSQSRPSIFSSADLQSLTFPGRRPHGRRYESALWLLGAGALHSAVGSCSMVVPPLVGLDWRRHG